MIVIRLMGGMGNQMFQYALYCALEQLGRDVYIDDWSFFEGPNNYAGTHAELIEDFRLEYSHATPELVGELFGLERATTEIIDRAFIEHHPKIVRQSTLKHIPDVFDLDNVYLSGFWQSEQYFAHKDVQARVRSDFALDTSHKWSSAFLQLADVIQSEASASIHVRLTDYLIPQNAERYGGICTLKYYDTACKMLSSFQQDVRFYAFSDDKAWLEAATANSAVVPVGLHEQLSDLEEFYLMSLAIHHILANSTYSWWAAWIGLKPTSLVIAPSSWTNNQPMEDIYTDRMIRLGG